MPQIIHVPPVRLPKQHGVDQKVRDRVLEFLDRFPPDALPSDLVDQLAEVMLARFGYGSFEGKAVAIRVLQALEKEGLVHIHYDDHGKKQKVPAAVSRIVKEPVPIALPTPAAIPKTTLNPVRVKTSVRPATYVPAARGEARLKRRMRRIGDFNECRFHVALVRLGEVLTTVLPSVFLSADVSRSGRHCPSKGKIDLRDHNRDDVDLRVTTPMPETGAPRAVKMVYDVKSSRIVAAEANGGRTGITREGLKRAIAVNHLRSDREFVGEVLDDMAVVGLGIDPAVRDSILNHFSD